MKKIDFIEHIEGINEMRKSDFLECKYTKWSVNAYRFINEVIDLLEIESLNDVMLEASIPFERLLIKNEFESYIKTLIFEVDEDELVSVSITTIEDKVDNDNLIIEDIKVIES